MVEEILSKRCNICGMTKPIGEFYKDKSKKDGFRNRCKPCEEKKKLEYKLNPIVRIDYTRCAMGMKICHRCFNEKPIEEFHKNKKSVDGLFNICRGCHQKYYTENSQRILKYKKEYYLDHVEEKQLYDKNYRVDNHEKIIDGKKTYYEENREYVLKKSSDYYLEHKEERQDYIKKYNKTPNGRDRMTRSYNNRRAKGKKLKNTLTDKQWNKILKNQNNCCAYCGKEFDENFKPTKDHIIPLASPFCVGLTLGNTQALCRSCNSKKHNTFKLGKAIDTILADSE